MRRKKTQSGDSGPKGSEPASSAAPLEVRPWTFVFFVPSDNDLSALTPDQVAAVVKYSAFISRLIPQREVEDARDDHTEPPGERWFRVVMSNWPAMTAVRQPVDGDALLRALRLIQSLPWMLRPVLVRAWYEAATELSEGRPLASEAADALRLTCLLLDSPMPEGLARQFIEPAER